MSSRHSVFFLSFFSLFSFFYHLHHPPSCQEKCHLGIQPSFPHQYLHYCRHLYHLHITKFQQGECHLGIHPLFPHHIFLTFIFFLNYIFLHLNTGSVIWEYCLFILIIYFILAIFYIIYNFLLLNMRSVI